MNAFAKKPGDRSDDVDGTVVPVCAALSDLEYPIIDLEGAVEVLNCWVGDKPVSRDHGYIQLPASGLVWLAGAIQESTEEIRECFDQLYEAKRRERAEAQ